MYVHFATCKSVANLFAILFATTKMAVCYVQTPFANLNIALRPCCESLWFAIVIVTRKNRFHICKSQSVCSKQSLFASRRKNTQLHGAISTDSLQVQTSNKQWKQAHNANGVTIMAAPLVIVMRRWIMAAHQRIRRRRQERIYRSRLNLLQQTEEEIFEKLQA